MLSFAAFVTARVTVCVIRYDHLAMKLGPDAEELKFSHRLSTLISDAIICKRYSVNRTSIRICTLSPAIAIPRVSMRPHWHYVLCLSRHSYVFLALRSFVCYQTFRCNIQKTYVLILRQIGTSDPWVKAWYYQLWGPVVKGRGHTRKIDLDVRWRSPSWPPWVN